MKSVSSVRPVKFLKYSFYFWVAGLLCLAFGVSTNNEVAKYVSVFMLIALITVSTLSFIIGAVKKPRKM